MKVKWKVGSRVSGDAAVFFEVAESLRKKGEGSLTPEDVVAEARKKRSKLHRNFGFIWDDAEAAEVQRKNHARYLLRSVEVVRVEAPNIASRAYEITRLPAKQGEKPRKVYRTTEDILADPVARDELLADAVRDAIAFRKRYAALSELTQVFSQISIFLDDAVAG